MLLSGSLSNWSVNDLLQIMRVTAKTATLRIDGSRPGVIHFGDGRIVGAGLAGQRVPRSAEEALRATVDALHVLTSTGDGAFLVAEPDFDPALRGWDVAEVMMEVERLRQMEHEVTSQGVTESTSLRLASEVATPVTLHSEEWAAVCALVPSFSLSSLQEAFGNSRALQFLSALLGRGLTVPAPDTQVEVAIDTVPVPEPIVLNEVSVVVNEEPDLPILDWLGDHQVEGAVDLSPGTSDDDDEDYEEEDEEEEEEEYEVDPNRRALRSVVASPETTLVSNVLGDMRKLRTGQS
ncbi:MAG TPA: DUF4388 domain-containing protein [Acidimicrobiia bacterium]|nr:DUF4388 domain-containing protein [Acidimicrobiia bacterium]